MSIRQAIGRIATAGVARSEPAPAQAAMPEGASPESAKAEPASPLPAASSAPVGSSAPVASAAVASPAPVAGPFAGVEGGEAGLLLVDANGLRLSGALAASDGAEAGDRVAAHLAGVSREAARATRLLGLGSWHAIAVECPDGHLVLAQSTADTVLLARRDPSVPMGRVGLLAERAARAARTWLETQA